MNRSIPVVALIGAVLAAGLGFGFLWMDREDPEEALKTAEARDLNRGSPNVTGRMERGRDPAPLEDRPVPAEAVLEEIEAVLRNASVSSEAAAEKLLEIASKSRVPERGRLEALEHGLNLLEDADYDIVRALIEDPETPRTLLDLLIFDLHGREERVVLETALELARREDHPLAEEGRELLLFFLEEDFGKDWGAWSRAVEERLAEAL